MDVGPHFYTIIHVSRGDLQFLASVTGSDGQWIYDGQSFRTLKQAKARAEDDALDNLRKEAEDLGLRVVGARR